MRTFLDQLHDMPAEEARDNYLAVLKLSCKLYHQVESLRVDNPLLNRPFMYNSQNLQAALIKDQLSLRESVITHLYTSEEGIRMKSTVDRVLDKAGRIVVF